MDTVSAEVASSAVLVRTVEVAAVAAVAVVEVEVAEAAVAVAVAVVARVAAAVAGVAEAVVEAVGAVVPAGKDPELHTLELSSWGAVYVQPAASPEIRLYSQSLRAQCLCSLLVKHISSGQRA